MKKIIFFLLCICVCILSVGCVNKGNIHASISEQTQLYFCGETADIKADISVGVRENPYILDGLHNNVVDFSLIVVEFLQTASIEENMTIKLIVNGKSKDVVLELNPLNMTYMTDVGYALKCEDEIILVVNEIYVDLQNVSENFKVDFKEAVDVGFEYIKGQSNVLQDGKLNYEGYLKILDGKKFGGEGLYWHFSLLCENGATASVLINVYNNEDVFAG